MSWHDVRAAAGDRPARTGAWCGCARATSTHETVYDGDPAAVARRFADEGAAWLHVVDLDGARGRGAAPARARGGRSSPRRSAGRGSRSAAGCGPPEAVAGALGTGAARAAVGTAALRDPAFARELVDALRPRPDRRRRSTSATATRSARAGARARPACRRPTRSARSRTPGSTPSRSPRSSATASSAGPTSTLLRSLVGLEPRPDHRLRRHRVDRRRPRGPGGRLRRRDRGPGALRGPHRPPRARPRRRAASTYGTVIAEPAMRLSGPRRGPSCGRR